MQREENNMDCLIEHICRHEEKHELYGEPAEIEAAIEKISDMPCKACRLEAKAKLKPVAPAKPQPEIIASVVAAEEPSAPVETAAPVSVEPKPLNPILQNRLDVRNEAEARRAAPKAEKTEGPWFVPLVGSEKQVSWGVSLRKRVFDRLLRLRAGDEETLVEFLNSEIQSKFWIDNKDSFAGTVEGIKKRHAEVADLLGDFIVPEK